MTKGDDYDLMQFTGLLDKNGKEIYEGDILKNPQDSFGRNYLISWQGTGFWHEPIYGNISQFGSNLTQQNSEENEVIGNIYENPDLLK